MDDLGEKLNAVLNDPGQMKRIADMAKSLMGGDAPRESQQEEPNEPEEQRPSMMDPGMLQKLTGLLGSSMGAKQKNEKHELLMAMKPFLSEKRRNKVDKALKIAGMVSVVGMVAERFKEDDGDGGI